MNVLIAGGAGFIGSHLCDLFILKGFKVTALDNLLTGNKNNIKHLLNNENFKFKKADITKKIILKEKYDAVLHFASCASPVDYYKYQLETLLANSQGTYNLLNFSLKNKAKFLYASTSEVYGDPIVSPQNETYFGNVNSVGKRSMYDEAKRFAEAMIVSYYNNYNLDTKIVRIFNTYGPRMRINDGRVIPNFINQALLNKGITVFGNGRQTRSFCFVSDTVKGIYSLLQSEEHMPVNIGNPCENTIKDIALIVKKLTESNSKIVYKQLPKDDPKRRKPDISKAVKRLKWTPEIKLEDGIKKTVEYFKFIRGIK